MTRWRRRGHTLRGTHALGITSTRCFRRKKMHFGVICV